MHALVAGQALGKVLLSTVSTVAPQACSYRMFRQHIDLQLKVGFAPSSRSLTAGCRHPASAHSDRIWLNVRYGGGNRTLPVTHVAAGLRRVPESLVQGRTRRKSPFTFGARIRIRSHRSITNLGPGCQLCCFHMGVERLVPVLALGVAIDKLAGMGAQKDGKSHQFLHHVHDPVVID